MLQVSIILTSLLWFARPATVADSLPNNFCDTENYSWQGGEEITYTLYYQLEFIWIAAGEATFRVKDLGDRYHISAVGKTINAFEWFYEVNDYYESVLDKETLLPISFKRDIQEGKYEWWDKFTFDQENNKVYAKKGWPDKPSKEYTHELSTCMHDLISIVYNVRNIDFDRYRAGDQFGVKVYVEEEYPLQVEIAQKDVMTKVRKLGKYKTNVIRPQMVEGHFFDKDTRMDVYLSADKNRIPLMIESPVSVGKVKAVLTAYKGLKYPLASAE